MGRRLECTSWRENAAARVLDPSGSCLTVSPSTEMLAPTGASDFSLMIGSSLASLPILVVDYLILSSVYSFNDERGCPKGVEESGEED